MRATVEKSTPFSTSDAAGLFFGCIQLTLNSNPKVSDFLEKVMADIFQSCLRVSEHFQNLRKCCSNATMEERWGWCLGEKYWGGITVFMRSLLSILIPSGLGARVFAARKGAVTWTVRCKPKSSTLPSSTGIVRST